MILNFANFVSSRFKRNRAKNIAFKIVKRQKFAIANDDNNTFEFNKSSKKIKIKIQISKTIISNSFLSILRK